MSRSLKVIGIFISILLLTGLKASAQENSEYLNLEQPQEGTLSETQLKEIAKGIRKLEANPYAKDGSLARSQLFKWLTGSPDVTVNICEEVIGPLFESKSRYKAELLVQYLLSNAAFMIENNIQSEKDSAAKTGGLRGALQTYSLYKAEDGKSARDKFMEKILKLDEEDKLESYVQKNAEKCQ